MKNDLKNFLINSDYSFVLLTLLSYFLGIEFKKRICNKFVNPLIMGIVFVIIFLSIFHIPYREYEKHTTVLSLFLVPVTICLAIPLYDNLFLLKKYWKIIFTSILAGMIANFTLLFFLSKIFKINSYTFINIFSKSVTTSIGLSITKQYGGNLSIASSSIIITGLIGSILANYIFLIFKIENDIAKGIALGTVSHAIGTTKTLEYSEKSVGIATVSMIIAGILTVIFAALIIKIY